MACQLIVVGVPGLTGAGAIQPVLDGRALKPEMMLLVDIDEDKDKDEDEEVTIEEEDKLATLDCAAIEEDGLLPPPPPPQDVKKIKLVISRISFTHIFMATISRCQTNNTE